MNVPVSTDLVTRLKADADEWATVKDETSDITAALEREAVAEIERLLQREHDATITLATALACGGYSREHGHWIADAAKWLNDRRVVLADPETLLESSRLRALLRGIGTCTQFAACDLCRELIQPYIGRLSADVKATRP